MPKFSFRVVKDWAAREGLHPHTVWKWCREGTMPVPVEQTPTGMWLIHDPKYETRSCMTPHVSRTTGSFGLSYNDPKTVILRRVGRVHCMENIARRVGDAKVVRMSVSRP